MTELKECVFIDGIRTPNARAHNEKGWFKDVRPDELLSALYTAMFERNPKVKPEDVEAVFIGTANATGMQNDIGRLAWLATGLPFSVPSQTICNQCPSGMSATMDAYGKSANGCGYGFSHEDVSIYQAGRNSHGQYR